MSNVWASLVAQRVKNLPAMQETEVWTLGQKGPPEKGMAITPVFLSGEFHGQRSLVSYSPCSQKELDTTEWLTPALFLFINVQGDTWRLCEFSNLSPSTVNIHWWSFLVNFYISCYEIILSIHLHLLPGTLLQRRAFPPPLHPASTPCLFFFLFSFLVFCLTHGFFFIQYIIMNCHHYF